jgi:hypothetical protein
MASENKLFKFYEELPSYGKAIALIGALGIVYVAYTKINSIISGAKAAADQSRRQQAIDADLAKLAASQKPSFSQAQYYQFADIIESALQGCDLSPSAAALGFLGTDADKIQKNVLDNLKNDTDFLFLQKAFGTKTIEKSYWCGYSSNPQGDLITLLTRILNLQEITYMNKKLAAKGITYKL